MCCEQITAAHQDIDAIMMHDSEEQFPPWLRLVQRGGTIDEEAQQLLHASMQGLRRYKSHGAV